MPETVIMQHFQVASKPDGTPWELGRGAMGVTYKAVDTELGGTVALKVISPGYLNDSQARERFLREARAAAYLHHPNIASVFHLGREGDVYFYAMEFVEGETLQSVVTREGALPPRLALRVVLQAAQGLSAANERGLIHRDIKPANLMVTRHRGSGDLDDDDLLVKVIDFGLAKSTAPTDGPGMSLTGGGPIGTPYYMSPEQIEPAVGTVDARSDIYSLGVTLWCLLTGKPPFQGTQFQIFSQHLHQPPPSAQLEPLHLPGGVGALLARMLAKEPADRPADHRELVSEIKALLRAMPEAATSGTSDPGVTTLHPPVNGAGSTAAGTPPAPTPSAATAGFPLVDVLRTRGSLPAADVLRLLEVLAPEVDAARREGPLDLRPVAVGLRFSPPPANLDALPGLSVRQWPVFTAALHPRTAVGDTSIGGETLLPGSSADPGADDVTRLAMLVYELLDGHPPATPTSESLASPISGLGEASNTVLCRTAARQGRFSSATEFAKAFTDAARTDGSLARADGSTFGRPLPATLPVSPGANTVVMPPPGNARRFALGVLVVAVLAAGAGIIWKAARPVAAPVIAASSTPIPTPHPQSSAVPPSTATPHAMPSPPPVEVVTATPAPVVVSPAPAAMPSATPALAVASPAATVAMPSVPPASPAPTADAAQQEEQEEKLLAALEARTKAARTLRVPKQFPTIQAAIDAAQSGDTVSVSAGHYKEALKFKEGLRLIGADRDTVTVTAPAETNVLAITDCGFGKITGITFKQTPPLPNTESQPAIFFKNSGVQFIHCRVANSAGISIYLRGKDHSTVEDCEVKDAGSDGIHMMDAGTSPTIKGNHVEGGRSHGILLHMHGSGTIINNVSEKNAGSGIIMMGDGVNPQLQGNRFLNNRKWGIQITRPATPNIASDNVTRGNEMGATHEETPAPTPAPTQGMQGM